MAGTETERLAQVRDRLDKQRCFSCRASPSTLLTTWSPIHSPIFALTLYSILTLKGNFFFFLFFRFIFFRGVLCLSGASKSQSDTQKLPSLLFVLFQGTICACKNMVPKRINPGNRRKSCTFVRKQETEVKMPSSCSWSFEGVLNHVPCKSLVQPLVILVTRTWPWMAQDYSREMMLTDVD